MRAAFEYAYLRMVAPSSPKESILARVLRLDPVLFMRTPVAHPESPQRPHKKSRKKRKSESPAAQVGRKIAAHIVMVHAEYGDGRRIGSDLSHCLRVMRVAH